MSQGYLKYVKREFVRVVSYDRFVKRLKGIV